jgi:glycosyltransferase involved in cell wall biosynthesis
MDFSLIENWSDFVEAPFVSVVIPAFNEEEMIAKCLQSITEGDYPKNRYQIVVIDNGSDDRTKEICQYHGAVVLENSEKKVSGLRNIGAFQAKGDLLAFLDADCVVAENWLREGIRYYLCDEIIAWGAAPRPPENSTWVQNTLFSVRRAKKAIQTVEWLESMNLFVRKSDFFKIGGFSEELVTAEDVDFCYRLKALKAGKILSDQRIRVFHLGEAPTIKKFFKKELWRGLGNITSIRHHKVQFDELPSLFLPLFFGFLSPAVFLVGITVSFGWEFLVFFLVFVFLPSILAGYRLVWKMKTWRGFLPFLFLVNVYFFARTVSLYQSLFVENQN